MPKKTIILAPSDEVQRKIKPCWHGAENPLAEETSTPKREARDPSEEAE